MKNNKYKIDNIVIKDMCYQSYPCQHYVSIGGICLGLLNGVQIHQLLKMNGYPIPKHFKEYDKNFYKKK